VKISGAWKRRERGGSQDTEKKGNEQKGKLTMYSGVPYFFCNVSSSPSSFAKPKSAIFKMGDFLNLDLMRILAGFKSRWMSE